MLKITDIFKQSLLEVYGEKENSCERFMALTKKYKEYFHMEEPEYFTSPGRMELIGNHTDHNGCLLYTSWYIMFLLTYINGSKTFQVKGDYFI